MCVCVHTHTHQDFLIKGTPSALVKWFFILCTLSLSLSLSLTHTHTHQDVLITGTPIALVKRFVKTGKKLLFSSEQGCCSYRESLMYKKPACDPKWLWPGKIKKIKKKSCTQIVYKTPACDPKWFLPGINF